MYIFLFLNINFFYVKKFNNRLITYQFENDFQNDNNIRYNKRNKDLYLYIYQIL